MDRSGRTRIGTRGRSSLVEITGNKIVAKLRGIAQLSFAQKALTALHERFHLVMEEVHALRNFLRHTREKDIPQLECPLWYHYFCSNFNLLMMFSATQVPCLKPSSQALRMCTPPKMRE